MVVYPEGTWYGHVDGKEVDALIEAHFIKKKTLPRLAQNPVDQELE